MLSASHRRRKSPYLTVLLAYVVPTSIRFTLMMGQKESAFPTASSPTDKAHLSPRRRAADSRGGFDAGKTCPASLKHLEAIAASAAADVTDVTDALDEDEHLPRDGEIIQDLIGLVDDGGGLASSDDESSDDESIFQRPMATSRNAEQFLSPYTLLILAYNDDVDVEGDGMLAHDGMLAQIKPMPSLDAGVLLCADNVAGADAATPDVASRFPSDQIQQRQE
jgi:hypothetical protein